MPGTSRYGIVSRMTFVEEFLADLAHGARGLRRRKRFAILSTLIIAIGIGGATAIFSVADAVVLRPLPYANADRLFVSTAADCPCRERRCSDQLDVSVGGTRAIGVARSSVSQTHRR